MWNDSRIDINLVKEVIKNINKLPYSREEKHKMLLLWCDTYNKVMREFTTNGQ